MDITYKGKKINLKPKFDECCVVVRIGDLTNDSYDIWWEIDSKEFNESIRLQVVADLQQKIKTCVLPFFKRFDQQIKVAQCLDGTIDDITIKTNMLQRLAYASLIYNSFGDDISTQKTLKEAYELSDGDSYGIIRRISNYISCSMPDSSAQKLNQA